MSAAAVDGKWRACAHPRMGGKPYKIGKSRRLGEGPFAAMTFKITDCPDCDGLGFIVPKRPRAPTARKLLRGRVGAMAAAYCREQLGWRSMDSDQEQNFWLGHLHTFGLRVARSVRRRRSTRKARA